MLKRTPGIWDWTIVDGRNGELKMVIVVKEEESDNLTFDFVGEPLNPTAGDLQLVTNAPEGFSPVAGDQRRKDKSPGK